MFIVKKGKKVGFIDGENGKVIAPAIYDQYEMFGSKGNHYRRWTLDDLVEACPEVLYYAKGKTKGVPLITIQNDIQIMRSDKLGYNAPIEVYEHKYYRYADNNDSITNIPMSHNDF